MKIQIDISLVFGEKAALAVKKLGETESLAVPEENEDASGALPSGSGVYAFYDELRFIGISRSKHFYSPEIGAGAMALHGMDKSEPSSSSGEKENFKLDEELELQEFQDKFVIKSHQSPDQGFWISRRDGNINLLDGDTCSESPSRTSTIYGLVGTIRLLVGTYVIVITSRKQVGSFLGFPVYRLMSMRFLACNEALKFSSAQEKRDEAYFMSLLKTVESTPGLYYSYETDITLNLQRRCKLAEGWMSKPIWKQADPRYIWNRHLLEELIECKLDRFIIPLLQGNILNF
ncbi:hypothetical protein L6164_002332 [Bauhinia variegata]|uniref:Uncharacterized protein n=1 Tax=Bauhinia variegata TaxID=167791 RepID=A0ACB9Q3C1_BAUVA|nr:hypothetical protein L6164_002332 [Bauhinia variegata]